MAIVYVISIILPGNPFSPLTVVPGMPGKPWGPTLPKTQEKHGRM